MLLLAAALFGTRTTETHKYVIQGNFGKVATYFTVPTSDCFPRSAPSSLSLSLSLSASLPSSLRPFGIFPRWESFHFATVQKISFEQCTKLFQVIRTALTHITTEPSCSCCLCLSSQRAHLTPLLAFGWSTGFGALCPMLLFYWFHRQYFSVLLPLLLCVVLSTVCRICSIFSQTPSPFVHSGPQFRFTFYSIFIMQQWENVLLRAVLISPTHNNPNDHISLQGGRVGGLGKYRKMDSSFCLYFLLFGSTPSPYICSAQLCIAHLSELGPQTVW